jgi:hypothetical protein|tara:strand:- start:308 stop:694 length:387 start_codon:yes stop_codon:yes gene_type:complete
MPEKNGSFKGVLDDISKETGRVVAERLEREGSRFVGVTLDCSEEHQEAVVDSLKRVVNGVPYLGGNKCVAKFRDLSSKPFNERDLDECASYRRSYPNAVFLFYDPKRMVGANGNIYAIDFRACLNGHV